MRAVRNTAEGVRVVDVPAPDGPGAVVTPVDVGICGSDLHVLSMGPTGVTIGHEIAALHEGRPVSIQPFPFCGRCDNCLAGNHQVCTVGGRAMYGMQLDGGMADQLLVDPACLVPLPERLDVHTACLVEPVAVGVHAVHKVDFQPGMRVAVIGAGCVGLVAGAVARTHGVDIDIAARHPRQSEAAEKLGLRNGVQGKYDVVIDAAGTDSSIAAAIAAAKPAATVVIPGIYWGDVTMPGLALLLKEIRLLPAIYWGMHDGEREIDLAARLLADHPELPDALITHRFPLDRAADAFAAAQDRASGAIKVVVEV
jgi:threonine dehydrogenase-like Zn-dependent dehydrogenase